MLAKRIIPVMLVRGNLLVKGERFAGDRVVGAALNASRIHASRSVDELCILDIGATKEGRGPDLNMIKELATNTFIPVSVGGGIRTLDQIRALLFSGADKIVIGHEFKRRPEFVKEATKKFGSQAIIVSIDWPRQGIDDAKRAVELGAGEILFNNTERDGTMCGLDIDAIKSICEVPVPVIACGGCSSYKDMESAFNVGASAVGVGALFQFDDATPLGAAKFLKSRGIETRI